MMKWKKAMMRTVMTRTVMTKLMNWSRLKRKMTVAEVGVGVVDQE